MSETTATEHEPHVHVVPVKILAAVFGTLIVLTVVTVAATWVDLGSMNLVVALAIATAKATVVALYFMHLRWDKLFNGFIFLAAIFFVMLFITITLLDTKAYAPNMIPPGNPPGISGG